MADEPDSPQPIARDAEIDALEYVVEEGRIASHQDYGILRSWLCRLRPAWESTPSEPSTPGEGTRQDRCTLTDAERFVLREVCAAYADKDEVKANEIAAVIDGLLERTRNGAVDGCDPVQ